MLGVLPEQSEVDLAVLGSEEDISPSVPALRYVMRALGNNDASEPTHALDSARRLGSLSEIQNCSVWHRFQSPISPDFTPKFRIVPSVTDFTDFTDFTVTDFSPFSSPIFLPISLTSLAALRIDLPLWHIVAGESLLSMNEEHT